MSLLTLNDIFFAVVERDARMVMMYRKPTGWASLSSHEFYRSVAGVARALREWGIASGDRVAIISENRPQWTIADFASLLLGAVVVPIYPTLTGEQTAYVLRDSGARVAFVSSEAQLQKVLGIKDQPSAEKIVVMDTEAVASPRAVSMDSLMHGGSGDRDPQLDAAARAVRPSDLAN